MPNKKMAQDLRDAGLRKKSAWALVEAADQARSGDRAARALVDKQSTALRDGIASAVRHAKPPKTKSTKKTSTKKSSTKSPAKKSSAKKSSAKKTTAKKPAAKKSSARKPAARKPAAKK